MRGHIVNQQVPTFPLPTRGRWKQSNICVASVVMRLRGAWELTTTVWLVPGVFSQVGENSSRGVGRHHTDVMGPGPLGVCPPRDAFPLTMPTCSCSAHVPLPHSCWCSSEIHVACVHAIDRAVEAGKKGTITPEQLLPPYTAAERSRELRHGSRLLLQRAKRVQERSMVLWKKTLHLHGGQQPHVPVSARGRSALQPVNVYEAPLSMGA
jgi:hypothetical protein